MKLTGTSPFQASQDTPRTGETPQRQPSRAVTRAGQGPALQARAARATAGASRPPRDGTGLPSSSPGSGPDQAVAEPSGGHAKSFVHLGPRHIGKLTSAKEADLYAEFGAALEGAIPRPLSTASAKALPDVSDQARAEFQALQEAAGKKQRVVVMEAVGAHTALEDKKEMDVKIGAATTSLEEMLAGGKPLQDALKKKARMTKREIVRGSRSLLGPSHDRGYTLVGRTVAGTVPPEDRPHGQDEARNRDVVGRRSDATIREMLGDSPETRAQVAQRLLEDMETIQEAVKEAPVTFIGSSVLMSIDGRQASRSEARLIDLAHPVRKGDPSVDYDKFNARFEKGMDRLMELLRDEASGKE